MDVLILGGTAWLGRQTAVAALARGHRVTCLARGASGDVAEGARLVVADRAEPGAYDEVRQLDWDAVVEVSWQPRFVRGALDALGSRSRHWLYVSSGSAYADDDVVGTDESAEVKPALDTDEATRDTYGEAKVACEVASRQAVGDRVLIARSGLIGGPGDPSDRVGYWLARAARSSAEPMLVPRDQSFPTQVVDVRDLAAWFVDAAEAGTLGTYNAVGRVQPFADFLALSRELAGHDGELVAAPDDWLLDQGVENFMGDESLALWLGTPSLNGFASRRGDAAWAAGLSLRPLRETLADTLVDERLRGLDRPRRAGLSAGREQELIRAFRAQK